jgi:hypothetical protein
LLSGTTQPTASPRIGDCLLDVPVHKAGEHVNVLFSVRAQPVTRDYSNHTIIPALCAKAGAPPANVCGRPH